MKLLAKYQRINITAAITVMILGSICFYFLVHYVLLDQLDEALQEEEQEVFDYVKLNDSLPSPTSYKDQEVKFALSNGKKERKFTSLYLYNQEEKENELTRQLIFPITVKGKTYDAYILKSQEDTEDLIRLIVMITLGMLVLLLVAMFIINRFLVRRLWEPFNFTLSRLKEVNLSGKNKLKLGLTAITEFNELNMAVNNMINRLSQEYEALKNFTENASHEMQTPLAVINSKLDVLIQDEHLTEQQMNQLQSMYNALDRLSRLNQSLLLLTKIENNQFNETSSVSIDNVIQEKLSQFEEMTGNKKLLLKLDIEKVNINCNKRLVEIMISNLLNNAIRYNTNEGYINIYLRKKELLISNTSILPALDKEKIFQRFYRHENTGPDGNGLGLSIIKQVCDNCGFGIQYKYQNQEHIFIIQFNNR